MLRTRGPANKTKGSTAMTASTRKTAAKKPTTPRAWKQAQSEPIELPSGNYMRVRRMSMSTLISTGKLPNSLLGIVQSAVSKGTGMAGVEDKMADIMGDQKSLDEMARFMDDLLVMVAVEPKVYRVPDEETDRDDDTLYVDEVDQEDKSFIFQVVTGGTTDLEKFREAAEANVATLSGREDLELPAVGAAQAE